MKLFSFIVLLFLFFVYRFWFSLSGTLSGGDWPYLFKETIQSFSLTPDPQFLWLGPYYQWTSKLFVQYLNLPWEFAERFWWFWMFLLISFFSSRYLSKIILGKSSFGSLTTLIFLTNTYILMVVGGGQMGVAMAYAIAPAVLASFMDLWGKSLQVSNLRFRIKNSKLLLFGALLGFEAMFDPRIAYITSIVILIYFLVSLLLEKDYGKQVLRFVSYWMIAGFIAFVVNLFWVVPIFLGSKTTAGFEFFGPGALQFFSFAHFEDALSLLHPNWPENLFGKTYFLKPEFLALPILAFSSLMFVKNLAGRRLESKNIIFFTLLGIFGIFMSKGVQEPFGFSYSFLFEHVPGFMLFRDPTKFYLLIVLSYSVLIPYVLRKISDSLNVKRINASILIFTVFLIYWIFLLRPVIFGQLSSTFNPHKVPQSYALLKNYLIKDQFYSKVLWVPSRHQYTFYSNTHPFLEATQLFGAINPKTVKEIFDSQEARKLLKREKVRYVILDEDTEGTLFVKDRKYSEEEYEKILISLQSVPYLRQAIKIGKIVVFSPIW